MAVRWEEVSEFIKNDKRTPDKIFIDLCDRQRQLAVEKGDPVPPDEVVEEGVRNLIRYCEMLMGIGKKRR
ncbi:MAG: hypothetical protein KGI29_10140 [Pseudomonadota bacterium]|nr:hypothetical protein [Pseudomonadota bacterium]MDE3038108.1 hypothetical protein [Pseudomonadota bacterium]